MLIFELVCTRFLCQTQTTKVLPVFISLIDRTFETHDFAEEEDENHGHHGSEFAAEGDNLAIAGGGWDSGQMPAAPKQDWNGGAQPESSGSGW